MRHKVRKSGILGRGVITLLIVATAVAALAVPVGSRPTAAQDDGTVQTRVQFLHAGPDVGKIEIHLNGDKKVDSFEYGSVSDWVDLDPGTVELQITQDRRGFNYAIFNSVYPVPAGNDYYVVITDELVMGGAIDISPVADGAARVRVVQASVDVPAVNVVATGTDVNFATQLSYPRSSDYVPVPGGTYDIVVNQADTGAEIATVSGIVLSGNMVYELVIMGEPGDDDHPVTITALADGTTSRDLGTPTS